MDVKALLLILFVSPNGDVTSSTVNLQDPAHCEIVRNAVADPGNWQETVKGEGGPDLSKGRIFTLCTPIR